MPLAVGHAWTYEVYGRRLGQVVQMKVSRQLAVDGVSGYELTGPLGTARLAWHGPRLVAETLGGTHYDPPIPLLDARQPKSPIEWTGTVVAPATTCGATALLTHKSAEIQFASRTTPAVETVLELHAGKHRIELDSWFVDGVGLVKQQERTDEVETARLSMTGGP
jgi:hypothetical protein